MDSKRLQESLARVLMHGDEVPIFFYSDLFFRYPETRQLFPVAMSAQRDRLVQALGRIVADVDNAEALVPYLRDLGRDHRKFGAIADHYEPVGASLIAALRHFSGPYWSADLEADWKAAYAFVAKVMIEAAAQDEQTHPPWWEATVVNHEIRSWDIAVIRVATSEPLPYRPGQSVAIQSTKARNWRLYSIANAPREDSMLDFHVRMVAGGMVSTTLTWGVNVGSSLRLGPAVGTFGLTAPPERDILMVAGGTGLAPVKAIVEQVAEFRDPPRVHLFFGARHAEDLYDLPDLEKMAAGWSWLTVLPAVSDDPYYRGETGQIADVVLRKGSWTRHDVYVAGGTAMVEATADRLRSVGVPGDRIHVEDFGWGNIT